MRKLYILHPHITYKFNSLSLDILDTFMKSRWISLKLGYKDITAFKLEYFVFQYKFFSDIYCAFCDFFSVVFLN